MTAKTQKVAFKNFNASLPNANRTTGFFCSSIYSQGQFEVGSQNGVTPQKWQAQYVLIISTQNVLAYQLICISFELCRATHHCDLTLTEAGEGSLSTRGSPQTSNSEVSCSVAGVPQQAGTAPAQRGVPAPHGLLSSLPYTASWKVSYEGWKETSRRGPREERSTSKEVMKYPMYMLASNFQIQAKN